VNLAVYKEIAQDDTHHDLVIQHISLVKHIAYHMKTRLPDHILLNDLIQSGMEGLIKASKNYLTNMGASFSTYASKRIRGAILDDIRQNNWLPRSVYETAKKISKAINAAEKKHNKIPSSKEIAQELNVSLDEYYELLKNVGSMDLFSLDEESKDIEDTKESVNPFFCMEQEDMNQHLIHAMQKIPEKELMILNLYYYEELNFKEIAEILEVSESRVCQLHGQALVRIKSSLKREF
jgi:RNA polymerase sigma factor for flagellar operon FliA